MSTVSNTDEFKDEDFLDMAKDLDIDTEKLERDTALNLKALAEAQLADLKKFKAMRKEMKAKREALDEAIKIVDKRIEISLAAITTIQK